MNDPASFVSSENENGTAKTRRWLYVALALILVGGVGTFWVQTAGGRVQVVGLKFPTENGQWVTADLFRPKTATEKNPAPLVVVCPGFERSKETMDAYSIELARRGMVVITIDPYNQGASSSTRERQSATVEGYGVVPVVEYVYGTPNLNYVDKSRIGVVGYSAGGNGVLQATSRFGGRQARALRRAQSADSDGGKTVTEAEAAAARAQNKISAVFVAGYVLTLTDKVLETVDANVGVDYAYFDEGAYRNEKRHAHLEEAPEALRLVNSGLKGNKIAKVEIGKLYGDATQRTLRVVYNTRMIHPLMPYDTRHIANMAGFFGTVFHLTPPLETTSQIWPLKEFFGLMSLVGAFLFLVPFTSLLLSVPIFRSLVRPIPPALPAPSRKGKIIFWTIFAASAVIACFLFIPLARATFVLFPQASERYQTWWFPQRINNAILLWAIANGLLGLLVFFATYQLHGKRNGATPALQAIRIGAKELALTAGLAVTVVVAFYGLLFVSYEIFHSDFRFTFVSAPAAFPRKMLIVALEYLPLFFVFYLANSIRVNCASRFEGQRVWVGMLINGLGNSVGLMLILAIQYTVLAATGTVYWTEEWLYVNLLLGVIPMMFLLPYFNRSFFNLTGQVYLGPMITCLIFILMMLTSNVCYIPLD